jgi:hypothetical protein
MRKFVFKKALLNLFGSGSAFGRTWLNGFGSGLLIALITSSALAFPLPKVQLGSWPIPPTFTSNHHFDGIVALDNCSGSIIRFESSKDSDQALVLTNGHCYEGGFSSPGEFISHRASARSFAVLDDSAKEVGQVNAVEVIYSTMTNTDITLYKLQQSYAQILKETGAHAFTLSSQHPKEATNIEVISGYWRRGYSCQIEAFVHEVHEANWIFTDSIRYSRPGCEVIGGTSGSPIVEFGTRNVIGINNTTNESGEECTLNNPCEVAPNGQTRFEKGLGYGQQTYEIYSCLTTTLELDLSKKGCQLTH